MKPTVKLLTALILLPLLTMAQPKWQINGVPVIQYGFTLQNAWAGGFNNPIFSPIDLNQDGLMDLFIYDKAGYKAMSFLNTGSVGHPSFTYAPQYDRMYPRDLIDWAVIRDYNHDGIGDIFALIPGGSMEVYKGFRNGDQLTYSIVAPKLYFPYGQYDDHIWTFSDNMPVMMDIDGDGAIDVLAPDVNAVNLDYCRNICIDSGWSYDSLRFVLQSQCWGHFTEDYSDCNVQLDQTCGAGEVPYDTTSGSSRDQRHQGGACWGTHYYRNNSLVSVFVSDVYCSTTKFLQNTGTPEIANITYVDTLFPVYDVPVDISNFPLLTGVDADNDGFEDIMAAPFASNVEVPSQSVDRNVIHYYHNNAGTDSVNTYHYEGDTLFNNSVVDVGTGSHAVFFDYNGDGLMDIVVGRFGEFVSPGDPELATSGTSISSLYLYENIGTATAPVYQLADTDWNHLSVFDSSGLYNDMYPAFGDLDGDGKPDMVLGNESGNISFFHNAGTGSVASYPSMTGPNWFGLNVQGDNNAAPFIYDVNGDGLNDLVIGASGASPSLTSGHIYYYWNFGTATNPMFSPDSVNSFFGNIMVWDFEEGVVPAYATPILAQENGQTVLYSGSYRGIVFKYLVNPDSLRSGTFTLIDSDVLGINPGRMCNISVADINHDGKNDYVVGNVRGGIMLFSDTAWSSDATNGIKSIAADNDQMSVFPNPAKDNVECRLGNGSQQLVSAQLYDMMGSVVGTAISHIKGNDIVLSVTDVSDGMYIVEAIDKNGNTYKQKISVIK